MGVVNQPIAGLGDLKPVGDILAGQTPDEDESVTMKVKLDMNKCYYFSVAADQTVDEMKLYLFNGADQRTLTKEEKGQALLANFCVTGQVVVTAGWGAWGGGISTASPGLYKVELKSTEGYGPEESQAACHSARQTRLTSRSLDLIGAAA